MNLQDMSREDLMKLVESMQRPPAPAPAPAPATSSPPRSTSPRPLVSLDSNTVDGLRCAIVLARAVYLSNSKEISDMLESHEFRSWHSFTQFVFMPYRRLGDVDYHQYIVALAGDEVWVAFRGSASFEDWCKNAQIPGAYAEGLEGAVHKGFQSLSTTIDLEGILELARTIKYVRSQQSWRNQNGVETSEAMENNHDPDLLVDPGFNINFIGHSLGGAIAQLCTVQLLSRFGHIIDSPNLQVRCITFAAPFVGDSNFARMVQERGWSRCFINVVSSGDIVPGILNITSTLSALGVGFTSFVQPYLIVLNRVLNALSEFSSHVKQDYVSETLVFIRQAVEGFGQVMKLFSDVTKAPGLITKYSPIGNYVMIGSQSNSFELISDGNRIIRVLAVSEEQLASPLVEHFLQTHLLHSYHSRLTAALQSQQSALRPSSYFGLSRSVQRQIEGEYFCPSLQHAQEGLAVVISGATTSITLQGCWLGLVLPTTLALTIGAMRCDLSAFNIKEYTASRLVFEGDTNTLFPHNSTSGGEAKSNGGNGRTFLPEIPNPSTAEIKIQTRLERTPELSRTCPVTFGSGVSTSAQWLVNSTSTRTLSLAVQYTFLGMCMVLQQEHPSQQQQDPYGRSYYRCQELSQDILRQTLDNSYLFKLLELLIRRATRNVKNGDKFRTGILESLQPHPSGEREMNLVDLGTNLQPLLNEVTAALDAPIKIPNLTRQILLGGSAVLAGGAGLIGIAAFGSLLTVFTGGIAGIVLVIGAAGLAIPGALVARNIVLENDMNNYRAVLRYLNRLFKTWKTELTSDFTLEDALSTSNLLLPRSSESALQHVLELAEPLYSEAIRQDYGTSNPYHGKLRVRTLPQGRLVRIENALVVRNNIASEEDDNGKLTVNLAFHDGIPGISVDSFQDEVLPRLLDALVLHQIRAELLYSRGLAVVGIKNAGKSTIVQKLWQLPTDAGYTRSTTFRSYKPQVAPTGNRHGGLTVYDYGGYNDIRLEGMIGTFLNMNYASRFIVVVIHVSTIGIEAKNLIRDVQNAGFSHRSMIVLVNQVDNAPRELVMQLETHKLAIAQDLGIEAQQLVFTVACKDEDCRLSDEELERLEKMGVKLLTKGRFSLKQELFKRIRCEMPEFTRMEQLFPGGLPEGSPPVLAPDDPQGDDGGFVADSTISTTTSL